MVSVPAQDDGLGVQTFSEGQAEHLAAAQRGTDHPGQYLPGIAAPQPPHQDGDFGPQFSAAQRESLAALKTYNTWPEPE
jgi:hypothetical protein